MTYRFTLWRGASASMRRGDYLGVVMDKKKHGPVVYLDAAASGSHGFAAIKADRIALIDELNRLSGPPSRHMATVQQEFIDNQMDSVEARGFANVCYGLLVTAVSNAPTQRGNRTAPRAEPADSGARASLPGYNDIFFSIVVPADIMELTSIGIRRDLVDRYNDAVGPPGTQVAALQLAFLNGELDRSLVARYMQQCEEMIEARNSLRLNRFG